MSAVPPWEPGEVRLWLIDLEQDNWGPWTHRLLSADERARRDRFVQQRDRRAYSIVRATARVLLGRHLVRPPASLVIGEGRYGKPHLVDSAVEFNVSHSGRWALIAMAEDHPVGVDIEQQLDLPDMSSVARICFSEPERQALWSLPRDLQNQAFFLCWSRKESFIKALGTGLSFPLDAFDVTLDPRREAALLEVRDPARAAEDWHLVGLPAPSGYAAALTTLGAAAVRWMLTPRLS